MDDYEKKTYRIGYFVTVDVEAYDDLDAVHLAGAATGWPIHRARMPIDIHGTLGGRINVTAKIISAEALMVKQLPLECDRCGCEHKTEDCPCPKDG